MLESFKSFFKRNKKKELINANSKDTAKERLQLVLMQDRANVSADFLDLMREEIIEVIKKYIDIDEEAMDVRLTNSENEDGTQGAPALYANIPIVNIKEETRKHANDKKEEIQKNEKTKEESGSKVEKKDIYNKKENSDNKKIENKNQNNNIGEKEKENKNEKDNETKGRNVVAIEKINKN